MPPLAPRGSLTPTSRHVVPFQVSATGPSGLLTVPQLVPTARQFFAVTQDTPKSSRSAAGAGAADAGPAAAAVAQAAVASAASADAVFVKFTSAPRGRLPA
jgi:hypothetical protein